MIDEEKSVYSAINIVCAFLGSKAYKIEEVREIEELKTALYARLCTAIGQRLINEGINKDG